MPEYTWPEIVAMIEALRIGEETPVWRSRHGDAIAVDRTEVGWCVTTDVQDGAQWRRYSETFDSAAGAWGAVSAADVSVRD